MVSHADRSLDGHGVWYHHVDARKFRTHLPYVSSRWILQSIVKKPLYHRPGGPPAPLEKLAKRSSSVEKIL